MIDTETCACGWPTCAPDAAAAHCHRCHEPLADVGQVLAHNRLFHPELDAEPPRWPDGEVCVDVLTETA